jgi:hypothetical protein
MDPARDSRLSDTALVVRWLTWAAFVVGALAIVDALGLSFLPGLAVCAAVGVIGGLLLRAFRHAATRHNLWPASRAFRAGR